MDEVVKSLCYRLEDFLRLLDDGDARPLEPVEHLDSGGIVDCGGGVSSEQCREPLSVGQGWAGGSIADGHQVPLAGGLGQSCADSGTARNDDDLARSN